MKTERVRAVLDRPTSTSLGMVGLVVAGDDGGLRTSGVLGSQSGPVSSDELKDLVDGGHALEVDEFNVESYTSSVAALWVGALFAEQTQSLGLPVPPLPQQTSRDLPIGSLWVAPTRHIWKVLDSWLVQAFRRVVQTHDSQVARLMTQVMPARIETRAAQWLTRDAQSRARELEWWSRLDRDAGQPTTPDRLAARFLQLIAEVEAYPPKRIFGFCAPAKGGDTEIAEFIADAKHLRRVSFGAYLRAMAQKEGRPSGRLKLQELGQGIIERRGELSFCLDVLEELDLGLPHQQFLIDGIRHRKVFNSLRSLVGADRFFFAFVDRPVQQRKELLQSRERLSEAEVEQVLTDPTEAEIPGLRQFADIELDGSRGADVEGSRLLEKLSA